MKEFSYIKDKLINSKGYARKKIESNEKFILDILSILTVDNEVQAEIDFARETIDRYEELRDKTTEERNHLFRKECTLNFMEDQIKTREKWVKTRDEELDALEQKFKEAKTDEARDRLVLARYFENNAYQNNSYERQKYNIGLALILSGNAESAKELEKNE